ncbi:hypothetical protein GCM10025779_17840 [Arthrobacter cryoconiti]
MEIEALFVAPKWEFTIIFFEYKGGETMSPKPTFSSIKRVFFTPVDDRKFKEMRDLQEQRILRVDLFNIR